MLRIVFLFPSMLLSSPATAQDGLASVVTCPSTWCDDGNPCTEDVCTPAGAVTSALSGFAAGG